MHIKTPGFYGKLPTHGDFIDRGLPLAFIESWDAWLQQGINDSRQLLGDEWLDIYLTSPVWEFALSPGVINQTGWLGILVPSVDKAGRYFSLCLTTPGPGGTDLLVAYRSLDDWFAQLTGLALEALHGPLSADQLERELLTVEASCDISLQPQTFGDQGLMFSRAKGQTIDYTEYFTNQELSGRWNAYGIWRDRGGAQSAGGILLTRGLPSKSLFCKLLQPDWSAVQG